MTDMWNARCRVCGTAGQLGLDVVLYLIDGETRSLCDDCCVVMESDGVVLERLPDQSGTVANENGEAA